MVRKPNAEADVANDRVGHWRHALARRQGRNSRMRRRTLLDPIAEPESRLALSLETLPPPQTPAMVSESSKIIGLWGGGIFEECESDFSKRNS